MAPVDVLLLLVLPQVAGFAATRWWRRPLAWPGVAFATFALAWYATVWAPAAFAAEQRRALHHCACGMWMVSAVGLLLAGLTVHLGGGALLAWLDRRAHRT
ncbi:MAG TPA: hypothetical protein VKZ18_03805 [Polyangia bacterium]|nr:hypothetical protein [Polyangia bacterium]